jgi:hypothetical protein
MKPQVMILLGVLAYALFANKGGASAFTPAKKGAKKGARAPATTPVTTKVTNIASAKKKKPLTAAQQKALKEKRRAM